MPQLKKLPPRLSACVYELFQLRLTLERLEAQLLQARQVVESCDAVPKKALALVTKPLEEALAQLRSLVSARGEEAQAQARAHFGKQGLEAGAVVELTYPIYGSRLDAAFDASRLPRRLAQATLKVEGFTAEHVRSRSEALLGVSGRLCADGKPGKDSGTFPLHPGCSFEILKPALKKEAARELAPPQARELTLAED